MRDAYLQKIEKFIHPKRSISKLPDFSIRPPKMAYCRHCCYPMIAVYLTMEANGICSGCRVNVEQKNEIDWDERRQWLERILDEYRSESGANYDCIIPVSGGKDSYFQVHTIKAMGLNPLLVTYHGNNYSETGMANLTNMREVFDCDHIFFTPSIRVLQAMNRLGFRIQGDMNWHAHCGIYTYPVQVAVKFNVPLILWGEYGPADLGGQLSLNDLVEMSARIRKEHTLRGYDWYDFMEDEEKLTEQDLLWAKYPDDEELERVGVRQLFLGNYLYWDANAHGKMVMDKYGFKESPTPFDRTYRRISNLDDIHENGVHDYMKYIKFGYGRCSDHVCKDIRAGHMTRKEGIELIRRHDPVKPSDLARWLEYTGLTEEAFDMTADTFRDPRVWWRNNGQWQKDNIWDDESDA